VNKVQAKTIRIGHQKTVDEVLLWLHGERATWLGRSFLGCRCGVGSLSLPLAQLGCRPASAGSDLSEAMVNEAGRRAAAPDLGPERIQFSALPISKASAAATTR